MGGRGGRGGPVEKMMPLLFIYIRVPVRVDRVNCSVCTHKYSTCMNARLVFIFPMRDACYRPAVPCIFVVSKFVVS